MVFFKLLAEKKNTISIREKQEEISLIFVCSQASFTALLEKYDSKSSFMVIYTLIR